MEMAFHPFARLPFELRLTIWELARREGPGAHFFSYLYLRNEEEERYFGQYTIRPPTRTWTLAAPRRNLIHQENLFPSWTAENPSAYLMDRGLWTACSESRTVMEKHYRIRARNDDPALQHGSGEFRSPQFHEGTPRTFGIIDDNQTQCCAVYPESDLFCLRVITGEAQVSDLVYINCQFGPAIRRRLRSINHLAYDFDETAWLEDGTGTRENAIQTGMDILHVAQMLFYITSLTDDPQRKHVWLIDKSLRRDPRVVATTPGPRAEWVLGDGRRLLEVHDGDPGWNRTCAWRFFFGLASWQEWPPRGVYHTFRLFSPVTISLERIGILAYI